MIERDTNPHYVEEEFARNRNREISRIQKEIKSNSGAEYSKYFRIAELYKESKNYDKAIENYKLAEKYAKEKENLVNIENLQNININIAKCYYEQNNYEMAAKYYENSLNYKQDGKIYWQLGFIYDKMKKYQQSIESYKKALNRLTDKRDLANVNYNIAHEYYDLGNKEMSAKYLAASIDLKPDLNKQYLLGNIYADLNNYEKAADCFISIIKKDSKNRNAYIYLAKIYDKTDNQKGLRLLYELAAENFPNNPPFKLIPKN